ncbi:hypothetical protein PCANB_001148 [Pneumocystis canis]|nr:hypothetical protein PCK1_001218 [Pneumocystis canis]KAG5437171.1 hypothetical protein PCANB_001148 [Pneumocystis canis]
MNQEHASIGRAGGKLIRKGSPSTGKNCQQGISSLQTIVRVQVFFLLSTLTKDNYDTTVMQLKDLYQENGPDIYLHLLRRLIQYNIGTILGLTRTHENPATYKLLSEEIQMLSTTPSASHQFGSAISGAASGIFNDFDIDKFCQYFDLDAFQKSILASSLLLSSKKELQEKTLDILTENVYGVVEIIRSEKYRSKLTDIEMASFLKQYLPENSPFTLTSHQKFLLDMVIREQYLDSEIPIAIEEALKQHLKLDDTLQLIVDVLKNIDLDVLAFEEALKEVFHQNKILEKLSFDELFNMISDALFIMSTPDFLLTWEPEIFGKVISEIISELNLENIIKGLDRSILPMGNHFKLETFLKGIFGMTKNDKSRFPLKFLWTAWEYPRSQIQTLQLLSTISRDSFDLLSYPCQKTLTVDNFQNTNATIRALAASLESQIWNCFDMLKTMIMLLDNPESTENASIFLDKASQLAPELVFLGSAQKQKPWSMEHTRLMDKGFDSFFSRHSNHQLVFIRLWQINPEYMGNSFIRLHSKNPACINQILNIAQDLKIRDSLLKLRPYSFSIDLAALASKRQYLNFEKWLQDNINENHDFFIRACLDYLSLKSSLENNQLSDTSSTSIRLRIETVADFLRVLMNNSMSAANSELFRSIQTICLQVYPRLMNIGQGRDEIITSNNETNTFSRDVEQEQETYYQRLYKGDFTISDCIILLQKLKISENPRDQDLFACMLHSLFDEYRFFPEYPSNALAITAILFGSLIQYQLLSYIPLGIALRYVLDAIQQPPNSNMFNFGVQALIQFQSRISEWPQYSSHILKVTHLQIFHPELVQNIRNSLGSGRHANIGGNPNLITELNQIQQYSPFTSLCLSKPLRDASFFEDPSESIQDKILFIINNMSHGNLDQKAQELREFLQEQYYSWFAKHLVVKRASTEPNYHSLYLQLLNVLDISLLRHQILHETYANIIILLNSEKTMLSTMERGLLKNLGSWLGGMTLSQNRPIKHNNIAFKELLLEGYDSKRLIVVLPFTCKVLEQAANSKIFKPPNAWIMGILRLLVELYESADIKLNLKFEIEVLCKKLDIEMKSLESTSLLKGRVPKLQAEKINENESYTQSQDKPSKKIAPEIPYSYNNLMDTNFVIPNLSNHLVINQNVAMFMNATSLKRVLQIAIDRAIREIIGPVVERSVTIAGISTKELITKDFATDPSEEKMKSAAHIMVQNLASSLALVTCREALRISITTNLRNILLQNGINNQQFPEQAAMLIVSDNLDLACSIIGKTAMERAIPEINENLSVAIMNRKRHKEMRSRHPFLDPSVQRVPLSLPDPLRLKPHGLTVQQLLTYEEFSRIPKTASQAISIYAHEESAQQLDTISDNNIYGTDPEISHQRNTGTYGLSVVINQTVEKLTILILELEKVSSEVNFQHLTEVPLEHDIYKLLKQICNLVSQLKVSVKDDIILICAQRVLQLLFKGCGSILTIETLSVLLEKLSEQSPKSAKDIEIWLIYSDDKRKLDPNVMTALIKVGLITLSELDIQLAGQIMKQNNAVIEFTASLIKKVALSIPACNFQISFANCLDAFEILSRKGDIPQSVIELLQFLHVSNMEKTKADVLSPMNETSIQEQLAYIFAEWIRLSTHPASNEKTYIAFILQLQHEKIITDEQLSYTFFRVAIDLSINNFIKQLENCGPSNNPNYLPIDSLSKLIVLLIKYYSGEKDDRPKVVLKVKYFSSILSIITLVFANYHETVGRSFHQKPFYKLFANILYEFSNETYFSDVQYNILETLGETFLALQPLHFPKFTFAWITLISHRYFMSSLLLLPDYKGYPIYNKIIVTLLEFISPLLEETELHDTTKMLYKGTLRLLLVLLHDFPTFLADYHSSFCSVIPSNCIQLRNLILSACPKTIKLPDPFQPGLKVDRLPECVQNPVIRTDIDAVLKKFGLRDEINSYLSGETVENITADIISKLRTVDHVFKEDSKPKNKINIAFINSLVLYIGMKTIEDFQLQNNDSPLVFSPTSTSMALFTKLHNDLDFEGRYYFLEAITNQLRYPNSHTYYFSSVLLYLFESSTDEDNIMKEQITRILLERFICNRPHPWGLLITFIELLKNSYYNFWSLPFIKSMPEIECWFNSLFSHINGNIDNLDSTAK